MAYICVRVYVTASYTDLLQLLYCRQLRQCCLVCLQCGGFGCTPSQILALHWSQMCRRSYDVDQSGGPSVLAMTGNVCHLADSSKQRTHFIINYVDDNWSVLNKPVVIYLLCDVFINKSSFICTGLGIYIGIFYVYVSVYK